VFWRRYGIDPFLLALTLWGLTGNHWGAVQVLRLHAARAGAYREGLKLLGLPVADSATDAQAAS
jgi:hypothetical protein